MFNRLVRGPVFAEANGVVRVHQQHALAHQCCHAHGIARVVGECQEGSAKGYQAAMQRHAAHHRGHAELTHAVVNVGAGEIRGRDGARRLAQGVVGTGEIRRTTQQFGKQGAQRGQRRLR